VYVRVRLGSVVRQHSNVTDVFFAGSRKSCLATEYWPSYSSLRGAVQVYRVVRHIWRLRLCKVVNCNCENRESFVFCGVR
jgi:hypothetical protein